MKTIFSDRIKELRGKILGIEMELNVTSNDLDLINENLFFLEKTREVLNSNIDIHKNTQVITIAKEYQKSLWQLGVVEDKVKSLKDKKIKAEILIESLEKQYSEAIEQFYKLEKAELEDSKVIPFRRKNG